MPKNPPTELNINRADSPGEGKAVWRCVHDGSQVLAAFKTSGQTECIHQIVDFDTFEQMQAAIDQLKLTPLPLEDIVDREIPPDEYRRTEHTLWRKSRGYPAQ